MFSNRQNDNIEHYWFYSIEVVLGGLKLDLNKLNSCILMLLPDEEESFSVIDLLYPYVNLTAFFNLDKARKNYMLSVSSKFACS